MKQSYMTNHIKYIINNSKKTPIISHIADKKKSTKPFSTPTQVKNDKKLPRVPSSMSTPITDNHSERKDKPNEIKDPDYVYIEVPYYSNYGKKRIRTKKILVKKSEAKNYYKNKY